MALAGAVLDELLSIPSPNENPVDGNPATAGGSDFFSSSAFGDEEGGNFALTAGGAPKVLGTDV